MKPDQLTTAIEEWYDIGEGVVDNKGVSDLIDALIADRERLLDRTKANVITTPVMRSIMTFNEISKLIDENTQLKVEVERQERALFIIRNHHEALRKNDITPKLKAQLTTAKEALFALIAAEALKDLDGHVVVDSDTLEIL